MILCYIAVEKEAIHSVSDLACSIYLELHLLLLLSPRGSVPSLLHLIFYLSSLLVLLNVIETANALNPGLVCVVFRGCLLLCPLVGED
ncbi:Hypothetical predicted protein [Olea europaea subsp. europaea]|uniref:Uncharacterized protein n=1 Tax=Olea europaea subsp. europaea TaxID=158383 RepID=A0A8S0TLX1_OLEEU|nr:Hypothetical predicted protein [Olea europaea subsp. europaea]